MQSIGFGTQVILKGDYAKRFNERKASGNRTQFDVQLENAMTQIEEKTREEDPDGRFFFTNIENKPSSSDNSEYRDYNYTYFHPDLGVYTSIGRLATNQFADVLPESITAYRKALTKDKNEPSTNPEKTIGIHIDY